MIGTTGVALDFIYQGIAKNRISLAPLSATHERLKNIMIARMNETIVKIDLSQFVENQVLQLQFCG
jgi:hypothetical protein